MRRKFANSPVPKNADPIPKLFELEDLAQLMRNAGIEVDAQTVLGTFVASLSHECYDFELRELSRKQVFDRDEIINLIEAQWNLLQKKRSKTSPAAHALIADGRGGAGELLLLLFCSRFHWASIKLMISPRSKTCFRLNSRSSKS